MADFDQGDTIISDGGTTASPTDLYERPIRQKVKVSKDIQTLPSRRLSGTA